MAWRRFGWAWNQLGEDNALGAILTRDGQVAAWNLEEFLATGRTDVDRFIADLSRLAPSTPRTRAMDFGCGVGRITRALAEHFGHVTGVDVAPSMIARAKALHAGCANCTFVLNRSPNLRAFPDGSFTVVYCRLVLQHIKPSIVRGYIPELVRVLEPGGVLMFQLPEQIGVDEREAFENAEVVGTLKRLLPRSLVVAWRRLKFSLIVPTSGAQIEMYGLPKEEVLQLIRGAGGRVLDVLPDHSHGYESVASHEFWVTR